ncbi:hypothetical protein KI387_029644, partial [Taxus chinensis]
MRTARIGRNEELLHYSTGTSGTNGRDRRENPAGPRTIQEMTRVTREKSKSQRASFEG